MNLPILDKEIVLQLANSIPQFKFLGIKIVNLKEGFVNAILPWRDSFIGDPVTKNINPAVIYSLVDSVCGIAVYSKIIEVMHIATLSIRFDHIEVSNINQKLYAIAECIKMDEDIAFVKFSAHQDKNKILVSGQANFKLKSSPLNLRK